MSEGSDEFCAVCRHEMPHGAQKCIKCGAFQNWRKHIQIGDSSLALLIAFLSVLGLIATSLVPSVESIYSRYFSSFSVNLVDIDDDRIALIISNPTSQLFAISNLQCHVPLVRKKLYFLADGDSLFTVQRWPYGNEVIGTVLLSFSTKDRTLMTSGLTSYYEFERDYVSSVFQIAASDLAQQIAPYCFVTARSATETSAVIEQDWEYLDLLSLDPVKLLELADFVPSQEQRRQEFIKEIER